eukprot:5273889-Amphidinium_carterae.1
MTTFALAFSRRLLLLEVISPSSATAQANRSRMSAWIIRSTAAAINCQLKSHQLGDDGLLVTNRRRTKFS